MKSCPANLVREVVKDLKRLGWKPKASLVSCLGMGARCALASATSYLLNGYCPLVRKALLDKGISAVHLISPRQLTLDSMEATDILETLHLRDAYAAMEVLWEESLPISLGDWTNVLGEAELKILLLGRLVKLCERIHLERLHSLGMEFHSLQETSFEDRCKGERGVRSWPSRLAVEQ